MSEPRISSNHRCCQNCKKTAEETGKDLMVCPKCKTSYYCEQDCFKKDWKKHKLICAGMNKQRKLEKKMGKMHEEYMNDPQMRAMIEATNRMNGQPADYNPLEDPTKQMQFAEIFDGVFNRNEVQENLWDEVKNEPMAKKVKKTLRYLEANQGRNVVMVKIFADLWEKQHEIREAIFDKECTAFYNIIADTMENDVKS